MNITRRRVPMEPVVVEATQYHPYTGDMQHGAIVDYACNVRRDRTDELVTKTHYVIVKAPVPEMEIVINKKTTWSPPPGAPRKRKPFP